MDEKHTVSGPNVEELLCPLRHMLDLFGGKWKLPILCILSSGAPTRYSAIKRKLGDITNVMLAQSLKELESAGIVHREQYNEVPPRVEYTLTEEGISAVPVLLKNAEWAAAHMARKAVCGVFCDRCQATT
ncbi:MAG: helix-turn-helix domain-containing protein [Candidatus Limiplasma sp.]|nr:helix-turn-helix domain-containing protein [Candidatus Limiplasma sp.]